MPEFFPWWVVITHFLNIFFLLLLARSGLEVLSAFPKLYWNDGCPPGREWARFSKKTFGADSPDVDLGRWPYRWNCTWPATRRPSWRWR